MLLVVRGGEGEEKLYKSQAYFNLVWVLMASSWVVIIEPAPYDILFLICLISGIVFSYLSFSSNILVPIFMAILFINANLISSLLVLDNLLISVRFLSITIYLVLSWVFVIGLLNSYGEKLLGVIFSGYLYAAILAALTGMLAYFQLIPHSEFFIRSGRVASLFKDPNVFGPFLVPIALLTLSGFADSQDIIKRLAWLSIFILLSAGILISFSRAAWVNFIISLLVYFHLPSQVPMRLRLLTLVTIIIVVIPIIFVLMNQQQVNWLLNQRLGFQDYDVVRFKTQLKSLLLVIKYPLGIGPGQSHSILGYAPHSLYIRTLVENGLLGIISLSYLVFSTFIRSLILCWNKNRYMKRYLVVVTASLAGLLVNSLVIDTIHWRHFWLLLALPWLPVYIKK